MNKNDVKLGTRVVTPDTDVQDGGPGTVVRLDGKALRLKVLVWQDERDDVSWFDFEELQPAEGPVTAVPEKVASGAQVVVGTRVTRDDSSSGVVEAVEVRVRWTHGTFTQYASLEEFNKYSKVQAEPFDHMHEDERVVYEEKYEAVGSTRETAAHRAREARKEKKAEVFIEPQIGRLVMTKDGKMIGNIVQLDQGTNGVIIEWWHGGKVNMPRAKLYEYVRVLSAQESLETREKLRDEPAAYRDEPSRHVRSDTPPKELEMQVEESLYLKGVQVGFALAQKHLNLLNDGADGWCSIDWSMAEAQLKELLETA
jgi:hypothetical protein